MSVALSNSQQPEHALYRFDRVHIALPSPDAITQSDIEHFWRDGFLAVQNVYTPAEVQAAKAGLSDLIAGRNPDFKSVQLEALPAGKLKAEDVPPDQREQYVRKIMNFAWADARLLAMRDHPVMMAIVERLLSEKATICQEMALLKPAYVGTEKPWHQDNAYFLREPMDRVMGTWTALDEATAENGCMHMIPGSHLLGPRPHLHLRDCQLPDGSVDVERDTIVPLAPGGVLFFLGLVHHGTPPNRSPNRRRALQFHYVGASCRMLDPDKHAELFHDSEGYAGCVYAGDLKPRRVQSS
jgi:phytanoyl-CoA hydroxylase